MKTAIKIISIISCFTAFALSTTPLDIHQEHEVCPSELIADNTEEA